MGKQYFFVIFIHIFEDKFVTNFRMLDYWAHIQDIAMIQQEKSALHRGSEEEQQTKERDLQKELRLLHRFIVLPDI